MWWFLLVLVAIGGLAQFIDGSLSMGFGASGSSLLLALGLAPAVASASIHAAEVVTTLASGTSHLRLGNVDRRIFLSLAVPGCLGGVVGATLLVGLAAEDARPLVGGILFALGALIVLRFLRRAPRRAVRRSPVRLAALGFCAAAVDAFGGGGWGPIATPGVILGEGQEPRKAIGSVSLAEFFVSLTITLTLIARIGTQALPWAWVGAVALGGVLVSPVAAYATRRISPAPLGILVGVLLLVLNARTVVGLFVPLDPSLVALATALALGGVAAAVAGFLLRSPAPGPELGTSALAEEPPG